MCRPLLATILDSGHLNLLSNVFSLQILHKGGNIQYLNSLKCLEILLNSKHQHNNLLNNITEFTNSRFLPTVLEIL